jgi:hypothetical protein
VESLHANGALDGIDLGERHVKVQFVEKQKWEAAAP